MFESASAGKYLLLSVVSLGCAACSSSDPTGSGGEGRIAFTTWGEEYIEVEIPADSGDGSGFVDGWRVEFDRFLVNFQDIVVADASGAEAARSTGSLLFDNKLTGVKPVVEFSNVPARAYAKVSYAIAPVSATTELAPNVTETDRALMTPGGYSIYVSGSAFKDGQQKTFAWGFSAGTRYLDCSSEQNGREEAGLVVTNNARVEAQLTTHGDHFFYDRLRASPNPAVETSLRFDPIAAADANDDGEVTLAELDAVPLDVRTYDPSGLSAATLGQFVRALSRTVGHYRGEGECSVSEL